MKKICQMAICLLLSSGEPAIAQSLLPKGVGIYQYGFRSFSQQSSSYDSDGQLIPIGSRFNQELDAASLNAGKGGAELKQLVDELRRYGENGGSNLADTIELGSVRGDVRASVQAQIFGLGFGLTRYLTVFAGVPWVSAKVDTTLFYSGTNNALAVKDQLGGLAFAELAAGLDRASRLSASQVQSSIEQKGYAPIDRWAKSGFGDLKVGTKTGFTKRPTRKVRAESTLTTTIDMPTGYVEDPDVLTDVSFGKGYYALGLNVGQRFTYARRFFAGVDATYTENFQTQVDKRVPESNESLVSADRKTTVNLYPGDDIDHAAFAGLSFAWLESSYRLGAKRHFSDRYEGSLAGNYAKLSEGSSTYQMYHEAQLSVSTAQAYQRKKFPVPFILSLKAHHPIEAKNSSDERYYEAQIASFFSTPMAR